MAYNWAGTWSAAGTIYTPSQVDKVDCGGNKLVRLEEYQKLWEYSRRMLESNQN